MKSFAVAIASALVLSAAQAQSPAYPDRPVSVVVGFAAGGPSDLVARAFAEQAGKTLGKPVIVDNKPGANATIAATAVANAKPDGYTLLAAATNHTMIPALYTGKVKFDALNSFKPICTLAASDTVLVVGPSLPVKSVEEFLARVRAKPGAYTYGTPGVGSSPHLATETFSRLTKTSLTHVPYKGAAPATTDLLGGQVDLSFATVGSVLPYIRAGKLTPLAVASRQRSALLPQVPTFDEAGVKGYYIDTWFGLLAPAETPAPILKQLESVASEFGHSPAARDKLLAAGLEPLTTCGAAFEKQIAREIEDNTRLARDLDLKPE